MDTAQPRECIETDDTAIATDDMPRECDADDRDSLSDNMAAESGDSESDDDDENGDEVAGDEVAGDAALEREWAATEIQRAWKVHCSKPRAPAVTSECSTAHAPRATNRDAGVCCSCFGPIERTDGSAVHDDSDSSDDPLFCAACLYIMTTASSRAFTSGHGAATPMSSTVGSPLPKLSKLVQAEARYQDQLQLLRAQRALLQQQQQEMQNRKAAQAQQLTAERVLARERRRLFQLAVARRQREEALKLGQAAGASAPSSGSPEQEDDSDGPSAAGSKTLAAAKPKRTKRMKEMLPIPFIRTLAPAPGSTKSELRGRSGGGGGSAPGSLLPSLEAAHEQQRRRHMHKMLGCYAQDLTPLVDGQKPKLLPVPSPMPSSSHGSGAKKTAPSPQQPHAKAASSKSPQVRLRPIEVRARKPRHDNQQEDSDVRAPPYARHTVPLTAEIKPISWVYSLGKGVLDDDDHSNSSSAGAPSVGLLQSPALHQQQYAPSPPVGAESLARFTFSQLHSVLEESGGASERSAPWNPSVDLRLQHQLPPKTVLASSAATTSLPSTGTAASSSSSSVAPQTSAQWEYSTDRLASLLEKYNVSVTTAVVDTSASVTSQSRRL